MKTLEEMIAVMQAYKEGQQVESCYRNQKPWTLVVSGLAWNWADFDYRIRQSLEDKAFEIYVKFTYPQYQGPWSRPTTDPMRAGLRAVIEMLKKEGLS